MQPTRGRQEGEACTSPGGAQRTVTETLHDNALVLQTLAEASLRQDVGVAAGLADAVVDTQAWGVGGEKRGAAQKAGRVSSAVQGGA